MSTLITTGQLTLYDYNDALIAGTPPTNPQVDTLWLDTSISPNMMKRWNGAKWDSIGELDPQYTEKIKTITGNITKIEKTLGNMADDGKLDLTDRQDLVDKLIPIIGYIPSSTDTALKTAAQLDSLKKGSFAKIRESAVDAGIPTTNTAYKGLETAWTNLRDYLNGLSPKPWDIGKGNEKNDSAVEKATFRTHWLNYYNAEYVLATATSKNLNTAITAINNTTIPALQNASLSNSEKAAINQSLLVLTSEKTGMNGEVVALKSNPKFLSQAALDTAKSNYDAAYSSVSSAIAEVMAVPTGTLIPSTLIGAVETAIFQYGEKLSALQREIQNAQTAISNKISADASAELSNSLLGYVDKTSYGLDIAVIQNQVDGAITSYFGTGEPTLNNTPAKDWTTNLLKDTHLGDLYYDNGNGFTYRFTKNETVYRWIRIQDSDITLALERAQVAQDTADGKRRAFYVQPKPPYDAGDLWVQGEKGELMRAVVTRDKNGLYHENDWVKAVKYTDDTKANAAATAASNAQTAANNAQADATKANNAVSDIISDSKMTPDEKVILQREWLNIQYERNEILSQAERYVIDSASYRSVYDTLSGYLAPFFTNLTTTQDVNAETLRSNFQRYYEQRQAILDAISVAAQQKVLDLQTQVDAGPYADKTDVLSGTEIFTDKADDSVVHVDIDGKSYQNAGSGKNLWDDKFTIESSDKDYSTYTVDGRQCYNFHGFGGYRNQATFVKPFIPKTPYTVQSETKRTGLSSPRVKFNYTDGTISDMVGKSTGGIGEWGTIKATSDPNKNLESIVLRSNDNNLVYWDKNTIQIEEGTQATPYEPPAPSPEYPIAIHSLNDFDVVSSVGKRNYWVISESRENYGRAWSSGGFFYEENSLASGLVPTEPNEQFSINYPKHISQTMYYNKNKEYIGAFGALLVTPSGGADYTYPNTSGKPVDDVPAYVSYVFRQNFMNANPNYLIMLEKGTSSTPCSPALEDIEESDNHTLIDKINLLLDEPLRSVGDVKDRLFRDTDGLWKIERNVNNWVLDGSENWSVGSDNLQNVYRYYLVKSLGGTMNYAKGTCSHFPTLTGSGNLSGIAFGLGNVFPYLFLDKLQFPTASSVKDWVLQEHQKGTPVTLQFGAFTSTIETLTQSLQNKLNNLRSFQNSNYIYTIVDKTNILPSYVRENLKPTLHATFKSQAWYQNYKRGDDLRHFVEVKGLDRAIRFGMLVDYQSFAMPTSNWLYFCKIKTSTNDFREELVDEDGSIFDYTTQREIKVPKQALDLREVAEGTKGYLAFDTRNQLMWFIHYQRNYTDTTNPKTGITEKIPSSEYWIKWNPGKTGHNTQLVLDESVYIVGEIER